MVNPTTPDFTDLVNYNQIGAGSLRRGNVIKARHVMCAGQHAIDVSHASGDQPTVVMHREGDTITAIEFICSCGASTLVTLEYNPA
ncbi:MAG: hypothetical protein HY961_20010 [Ignavibacteriae bacterium]|nr:hypothetical protein [Ignavibacteriota bacterium]